MPRQPPVPIVLLPPEETWVEYHKGARYTVSVLGIGMLLFLVLLVMIVALTIPMPIWLLGLVAIVIAALLFWFVPQALRILRK